MCLQQQCTVSKRWYFYFKVNHFSYYLSKSNLHWCEMLIWFNRHGLSHNKTTGKKSIHSTASLNTQRNSLCKMPQKNNSHPTMQQENCTSFANSSIELKSSPFFSSSAPRRLWKWKGKRGKKRSADRDLLCDASQRLIIGLIMMSILPAGAGLWKCTGFVLPHPDGADGAWHGVDEQPPECVPPPGSSHAGRDVITRACTRTHTLTLSRTLRTMKCTQTKMCHTPTRSERQRDKHHNNGVSIWTSELYIQYKWACCSLPAQSCIESLSNKQSVIAFLLDYSLHITSILLYSRVKSYCA